MPVGSMSPVKNALASENRRQAKLARHKSKSIERQRAYRARLKDSQMSRIDDISHIDAQANELNAMRQTLVTVYQEYHAKIGTQIEKILKDADVWDTIKALEAGREQRRSEDQVKVNQMGAKIDEIEKVKAYLLEREAGEATGANTVEGAPAVVEGAPPVKALSKKESRTANR